MKNGKLQIGLIGCGGIANNKHMPALKSQSDKCEMTAFCDIIKERAEKAAKEYGTENAKVYTDYNEMLKDKEIDVVHVLTPNVVHCPATVAAFEAGKHVLCEKPMAHNTEDAKKMLDTSKRTGKLLTIGYQYRHFDANRAMKDYVSTGALGDIYYAETTAIRRRGIPTWGVFTNKAEQGGGPLIDIATHSLDLTLWMMNNYEVESVTGVSFAKIGKYAAPDEMGHEFGAWDPAKYEVEDSAFGFVRMKNGALINLRCSWALNMIAPGGSVLLCGTKGGLDNSDGVRANHVVANRQLDSKIATRAPRFMPSNLIDRNPMVMPNVAEAEIWVNALLGKGGLFVTAEQAYTVTRILDAIYQSSATGKTAYFD